jgi:hypothetical protein
MNSHHRSLQLAVGSLPFERGRHADSQLGELSRFERHYCEFDGDIEEVASACDGRLLAIERKDCPFDSEGPIFIQQRVRAAMPGEDVERWKVAYRMRDHRYRVRPCCRAGHQHSATSRGREADDGGPGPLQRDRRMLHRPCHDRYRSAEFSEMTIQALLPWNQWGVRAKTIGDSHELFDRGARPTGAPQRGVKSERLWIESRRELPHVSNPPREWSAGGQGHDVAAP